MLTGDWISTFMALIAAGSAMVTFAVYRSSTDPLIIVYADPDLTRPSIINLIIKNIGNGPAHKISFSSTKPLPSEAFGITEPETNAKEMSAGPIVAGIPFLAPNQQIVLTWGQYGGLQKYIGDTPINITSTFYRSFKGKFISRKQSVSALAIQQFQRSNPGEHGFGPNIVKELKSLNSTIKHFEKLLVSSKE